MGHPHRYLRKRTIKGNLRTLILLAFLSLFGVLVIFGGIGSKAPYSSEARFTDVAERGMQIVPASGGSIPSGCGPGTLNDTCPPPSTPYGCGPGTLNDQCPPPSTPHGCGSGTLNDTCPPSTTPHGCGPGTLNDQCPLSIPHGCGPGTLNDRCSSPSTPSGCGPGTLNDTCPPSSSCPTTFYYCSASDLYQRTYGAAPACRSQDTFITHCDLGCNPSTSVCNSSTGTAASITARPSLVRSGNSTTVSVQATGVRSCVVNGTNGDTWICSNANCAAMSRTSSPLRSQTSYMLTCSVPAQSNIVKSTTVNIVPVFNEQ